MHWCYLPSQAFNRACFDCCHTLYHLSRDGRAQGVHHRRRVFLRDQPLTGEGPCATLTVANETDQARRSETDWVMPRMREAFLQGVRALPATHLEEDVGLRGQEGVIDTPRRPHVEDLQVGRGQRAVAGREEEVREEGCEEEVALSDDLVVARWAAARDAVRLRKMAAATDAIRRSRISTYGVQRNRRSGPADRRSASLRPSARSRALW